MVSRPRILTVGVTLLVTVLLVMPVVSIFGPGMQDTTGAAPMQPEYCPATCSVSSDCAGQCSAAAITGQSDLGSGNPHTTGLGLSTLSLSPVTLTRHKPPPKLS